jgi:hypothetical protein
MLHVICLAQYATAYTRSWAADSTNGRIRIKAENDRAQQDIPLFREEMRIKDARMVTTGSLKSPGDLDSLFTHVPELRQVETTLASSTSLARPPFPARRRHPRLVIFRSSIAWLLDSLTTLRSDGCWKLLYMGQEADRTMLVATGYVGDKWPAVFIRPRVEQIGDERRRPRRCDGGL